MSRDGQLDDRGAPDDERYWRGEISPADEPAEREAGESGPAGDSAEASTGHTGYTGPPPMVAPPSDWRPPHLVEPAPPRELPMQDHFAIDDAEARARTLTQILGLVASLAMLVLLCALCARLAI